MKTIRRLGSHVSAAILAATLGMPVAVGALAVVSTPAYAQTTLSSAQLSAIGTSLATALQAAHGDIAAIEAAISQALQNDIALYGSDATAEITSAIISYLEQPGVTPTCGAIGTGLAQAAAAESVTNVSAATTIAKMVANEGTACEVAAFQSTATSLGYSNLASIAGSGATPTGLGSSFGGGFPGGGGAGFNGGCLNPSCTKP